jgi:hypothetical protein
MTRIDISDEMNDSFFVKVHKKQVLTFERDGGRKSFKIVRLNRQKKICVVEPVTLHTKDEAEEIMKKDMTLEDIVKEFDGQNLSTTEDVQRVLVFIAPPGKKQVLKRQAIEKLFKGTSPQGFKVVDSIESYEEF